MAGTKANSPDIFVRGLYEVFSTSYDEVPSKFTQLYHVIASQQDYEEFLQTAGFGYAVQEGELEIVSLQDPKLGYRTKITPVRFGLGFEVSRDLVEDEKYGWIASLTAELARSLRATREKHAADLINNGFTAGAYALADGKALFATDHPLVRGGTGSNRLAADSDLTYSSLQSMVALLSKVTNDASIPIPVEGTMTLLIPRDYEFTAAELLKSVGRPDTANRADNVLTKQRSWQTVIWDFITDTDMFAVLGPKNRHKLIFVDRMKVRQWVKDDEEAWAVKHIARTRIKVGAADWRGVAATPGAP